MHSHLVEEGAFADARHPRHTDAPGLSRMRKKAIENFGGKFVVRRKIAFDDGYGSGERRPVSCQDTGDVLFNRQTACAQSLPLQGVQHLLRGERNACSRPKNSAGAGFL